MNSEERDIRFTIKMDAAKLLGAALTGLCFGITYYHRQFFPAQYLVGESSRIFPDWADNIEWLLGTIGSGIIMGSEVWDIFRRWRQLRIVRNLRPGSV